DDGNGGGGGDVTDTAARDARFSGADDGPRADAPAAPRDVLAATDAAASADVPPVSDAPPAPSTARPDATNTGVRPGTRLVVVTGDQTITTSDQVITGMDYHGFVTVRARNVTFRDCVFRGRATSSNAALLDTEAGTNIVVEDCEFVPAVPSATID